MKKFKRKFKRYYQYKLQRYNWVWITLIIIIVAFWGASKIIDATQDHDEARLMRVDTPEISYKKALDLEAKGDVSGCKELMLKLASLSGSSADPRGYAPAHVWMAKHLLGKFIPHSLTQHPFAESPKESAGSEKLFKSHENILQAQKHLEYAVNLDPKLKDPPLLLAELYLAQNDRNKAVNFLISKIAHSEHPHPELHIPLANALAFPGDDTALEEKAWHSLTVLGKEISLSNHGADSKRVEYILNALVLKKFDNARAAARRIARGAHVSDSPEGQSVAKGVNMAIHYHQAIAFMDVGHQQSDYTKVVEELGKALSEQPDNSLLLDVLMSLSKAQPSLRDAVKKIIKQSELESTQSSREIRAKRYLLLSLLSEKDLEMAIKYAEQSVDLKPDDVDGVTQLALLLCRVKEPDYVKIKNTIKRVIPKGHKVRNAHSEQYFVYGYTLTKLKRWGEAIVALEKALPGSSDPKKVHALLAQAYEGAGKKLLASGHRSQSK